MKYKSWEERIREDERKKILNEIKQRKQKVLRRKRDFWKDFWYYLFQKAFAIGIIVIPLLLVRLIGEIDGVGAAIIFFLPISLYMFFAKHKVFLEDYYDEN